MRGPPETVVSLGSSGLTREASSSGKERIGEFGGKKPGWLGLERACDSQDRTRRGNRREGGIEVKRTQCPRGATGGHLVGTGRVGQIG